MATQIYFWQRFQTGLISDYSPNRLAAGVAMGVLIGLIPKESMLVPLLVIVLVLSRASLLMGFFSSILFFLISQIEWLRLTVARGGMALLESSTLAPFWGFFMEYPFLPWLKLDSPLTVGWLTVGIVASVASYLLSRQWFIGPGAYFLNRVSQHAFLGRILGQRKPQLNEG